jgi:phage terminase large subunit-like protein
VDPTFFMAWWEASRDADHRLEATWKTANPGYGDLVAAEDFASAVRRTPEAEFRTKRCGQWVAVSESWLPHGAWSSCADPHRIVPKGSKIVLSFDGSKTGDSTALLGVTVEDKPHLFVVGSWERPPDALDWRVPRTEVKDRVREACRTWNVAEVAWDDWMWQDAREELEDDGLPIEVFPQTAERMGRATQRFFEAVVDHGLTHDGNPALARHLENAVLKPTPSGKARIVKSSPSSKAWIDLAVTGVMGVDRADWWNANTNDSTYEDRGLLSL